MKTLIAAITAGTLLTAGVAPTPSVVKERLIGFTIYGSSGVFSLQWDLDGNNQEDLRVLYEFKVGKEGAYTLRPFRYFQDLNGNRRYEKNEIMEMYLNRIPYGANIYGIEVASQTFFGKPAVELTIAESAVLAAIPKAPTYYSPYGNNIYVQVDLSEEEIFKRDIRSEQELVDFISKGLLGKTYTYAEDEETRDIYVKGRVDFVLERMK